MPLTKIGTIGIDDNAITATQIATDAVDSAEIAANAVDTAEIAASAVETAKINDDAVTLAKQAGLVRGKIIYGDASGDPAALTVGSSGQVLKSDGTDISWGASPGAALTGSTATWIPTITGASALTGTANFTYDGNILDVKNSGTASSIKLYCESSNAHYQAIKAAPHSGSSDWTLTLPPTVPSVSGQSLTATTAGVASWTTVDSLPTQTSNDGYSLVTDGTDASWHPSPGRNMVINAAMDVNLRASGNDVTSSGHYDVDRYYINMSGIGTWDVSQSGDGPDGFRNCWSIENEVVDASPAATDYLALQYKMEGRDLQQLAKGTSGAKSTTLSFWVKSFQTGNYQVNLNDVANTRMIGATYTINTSATWEYKTMTFAGDTSGTLADDSTSRLVIEWWLDSGSDYTGGAVPTAWEARVNTDRNATGTINLADNTSNYFKITGIQFEIGSQATPFEYKTWNESLLACQRYFQSSESSGGQAINITDRAIASASTYGVSFWYQGRMRSAPTITLTDDNSNSGKITVNATNNQAFTITGNLKMCASIFLNGQASGLTSGDAVSYRFHYQLDSEI